MAIPLILMGAAVAASAIRAGVQAKKAKKFEADFEAKDKALQPVSPEQYAYLNRVRQMQRSMAMGTDPTSAMAQRGLSQSLAQTQGNIARLGTGSSTVSGLLRAQQGYNMGMGQVAGQAFDQSRGYMQQEQGLIDNIQNSIYGLQMKRRNYAQQKAVAMRQDASDSATAAIAGLGQMATMIPNKVGGDVDLSKDAISKMNPNKFSGIPSSSLSPTYAFGDLNSAPAQDPYAGFRFSPTRAKPSLASQYGGLSYDAPDFGAPGPFGGF